MKDTFSTLPLDQKKSLLANLKLLRKLRKISRKRADSLYAGYHWFIPSTIEYVGELSEETKAQVEAKFRIIFPNTQTITWKKNANIQAGVRLLHGDAMIDISLAHFESLLF